MGGRPVFTVVTITFILWQLFLMRFEQKMDYVRAEQPVNYVVFLDKTHNLSHSASLHPGV